MNESLEEPIDFSNEARPHLTGNCKKEKLFPSVANSIVCIDELVKQLDYLLIKCFNAVDYLTVYYSIDKFVSIQFKWIIS